MSMSFKHQSPCQADAILDDGLQCILFLLVLLGLFMPGRPAPANTTEALSVNTGMIEERATGQINWTQGVIRAIGSQPPQARSEDEKAYKKQFSSAKSRAQQQLLTAIKGIRIYSDLFAEDFLGNHKIMAELQTLIIETAHLEREYLSDGTVRVVLEIPFHGAVSQLLLPQEIQSIQPINSGNHIEDAIAPNDTYTGLIVDARTLGVQPMLAPEIIDDTGEPVYGPAFVSREFVVSRGMASYVRRHEISSDTERVGPNPLIIHGLKLADNSSGAIVVSSAEAAKVREVSDHFELLRQCKVIIRVQ